MAGNFPAGRQCSSHAIRTWAVKALVLETINVTNLIESELLIGDASKVLWVWYYYGKQRTYDNMYVRQYRKDKDGIILRAEGRRRDVKNDDGIAFKTKGENAICIVNSNFPGINTER